MKKQYYIVIVATLLVLCGAFYWYELRPYFGKKECYKRAEMWRQTAINSDNNVMMQGINVTRSDYEKIFQDDYETCLMQKGLKE